MKETNGQIEGNGHTSKDCCIKILHHHSNIIVVGLCSSRKHIIIKFYAVSFRTIVLCIKLDL